MYLVMEKKVYVIKKWYFGQMFPEESLCVLPRGSYDDSVDAWEQFRKLANGYLGKGCVIKRIVHFWNYDFVSPSGVRFNLYMYED